MRNLPLARIVVGIAFVCFAVGCEKAPTATPSPLLCYVGGTMRPVLEELARLYEQETGRAVQLDYGDSGTNLVKIETTGQGDLSVCHDPFQNALVQKGQSRRGWTVASLTPAIAVPKGNPRGIRGLEDLAREGLRLGLTHETYSTLGHICPIMFDRATLRPQIEKNVVTRMRMGGEAANGVIQGHLDAAIVWNAVIWVRREKLDMVPISPAFMPDPARDVVTSATFGRVDMSCVKVTIDVLACSKEPAAAEAFAQFVASPRGRAVFQANGFSPPPPEAVSAEQAATKLLLYCGAGLRPAVDDIVDAFAAATGIRVECDYAGSGILLSRIQLARMGDLYLPAEMAYVEELEQKMAVASKRAIGCLVPVILVKKGNPAGIRALADLGKEGVKLGLGNPDACQIGKATERLIAKNGLDAAAISRNVVFSSLTVNELGVQIKAGQIDATVVWDAIAAYYADVADAVAIPPEQNEISTVGIAVLESSKDKKAAESFVEFLTGPQGRALLAKHQYRTEPPR